MKRFILVGVLALAGCSPTAKDDYKATLRASAAMALDYSACIKSDFESMAFAGTLSKDAALMSAEKCGFASIPDAIAILVAAYNDTKAKLLAKYGPKPVDADAGAP